MVELCSCNLKIPCYDCLHISIIYFIELLKTKDQKKKTRELKAIFYNSFINEFIFIVNALYEFSIMQL